MIATLANTVTIDGTPIELQAGINNHRRYLAGHHGTIQQGAPVFKVHGNQATWVHLEIIDTDGRSEPTIRVSRGTPGAPRTPFTEHASRKARLETARWLHHGGGFTRIHERLMRERFLSFDPEPARQHILLQAACLSRRTELAALILNGECTVTGVDPDRRVLMERFRPSGVRQVDGVVVDRARRVVGLVCSGEVHPLVDRGAGAVVFELEGTVR